MWLRTNTRFGGYGSRMITDSWASLFLGFPITRSSLLFTTQVNGAEPLDVSLSCSVHTRYLSTCHSQGLVCPLASSRLYDWVDWVTPFLLAWRLMSCSVVRSVSTWLSIGLGIMGLCRLIGSRLRRVQIDLAKSIILIYLLPILFRPYNWHVIMGVRY